MTRSRTMHRRAAVLGLIGAGVGALAGTATVVWRQPTYAATASVMTSIEGEGSDEGAAGEVAYTMSRVPEYGAIASTDNFLARVITDDRLLISMQRLRADLRVSSPKLTSIITVSVQAPSAVESASLTDSVAGELADVIPEREANLPMRALVVEKAVIPDRAIDDPPSLVITQDTVAGLATAGAVWLVWAVRSGRRDDAVARQTGGLR